MILPSDLPGFLNIGEVQPAPIILAANSSGTVAYTFTWDANDTADGDFVFSLDLGAVADLILGVNASVEITITDDDV